MANDKKLPVSVVITAVDNLSYKMIAIQDKVARISKPIKQVQTSFGNLANFSGIDKIGASLSKVGSTGKAFFSDLAGAAFGMSATLAAVGAGIFSVASSFAHAGDEIEMMSSRLGLSTTEFQKWSYAAKIANVDQEQFNGAMGKFSKGIGEAAAGSGEARIGLEALGLSAIDSKGKIQTLSALFPQVAERLGNITNQNLRNAIAAKIFGKEGAKLNDMFNEGADGLKRYGDEAERIGAVMSPEDIHRAAAFDKGMKQLTATLTGVRNVVGAALAPALLEMGLTLQKYIIAHIGDIKAFAEAFAAQLPGTLENLFTAFKNIASALSPIISFFGTLSESAGALNVVLGAMALYFGAGLVASLASFVAALSAFNFALLVSPVGLFLISLTAIVAAVAAIYHYWDDIVDAISRAVNMAASFAKNNFFEFLRGGVFAGLAPEQPTSLSPQLGQALGFDKSFVQNSSSKNENHVVVEFQNMPAGSIVEKKKDGGNMDLYQGYGEAF